MSQRGVMLKQAQSWSNVTKRLRSGALLIVVASAIGLMIGIAKTGKLRVWQAYGSNMAQPQGPAPKKEISIESYVVPGLPITMSNIVVVADKRNNQNDDWAEVLKFSVTNQGEERLTSLNLALLDFNRGGHLRQVDGWVKKVEMAPDSATEVVLGLKRRVTSGSRLVLTIERVNGVEGVQEVHFTDLAQTIAALVWGETPQAPGVQRADTPIPDDHSSSLCHNAFIRAMNLSQAGDRTRVTSYTCDQNNLSWSFTFNGKLLTR
jgi:hypothetical protein